MLGNFFVGIGKSVDFIFSPFLYLPPYLSVALLAFLSTLIIIGATRLLTNKEELKKIREKSKEIKEKMIKAQKSGNKKEVSKLLDEMMKINNWSMKNSLKTMGISLIVGIIVFSWLSFRYSNVPMFVLPFTIPLIGNKISWLLWYILIGFIFSAILNKLIGVTP